MKSSGKVIAFRLEGQRERIAWHEPCVAVGEEIPPATVVKVRDFPAKLHPGNEGLESRVEGTNPTSLSPRAPTSPVQLPVGKGPHVIQSIEINLRARRMEN